jgi:hypothetical protein
VGLVGSRGWCSADRPRRRIVLKRLASLFYFGIHGTQVFSNDNIRSYRTYRDVNHSLGGCSRDTPYFDLDARSISHPYGNSSSPHFNAQRLADA